MDNKNNKIKELKQGQKIAFIASFVTLLLAVMKATIGYLFDSKVLVADAFHSGADLLAICASGFGLWVATKQKTKKFPYGLYKAETLITFVVGALIVWAGIEMVKEGYNKLIQYNDIERFPLLPVTASIISIIIAYILAQREKAVGILINSQSLMANAKESYLDIVTSFVVLCGIVLAYLHIPYIEGVIIIFIAFLIFKLGFQNLYVSLLVLMDANLDTTLQEDIEEKINSLYGVKGVSEVKIRQSGPFKMVECKIATSPTLPLYKAHELANKAEEFIMSHCKHIESVFIHVEPSKEKMVSAIIPVNTINGLDSKVHGHFGRAPYYIILRLHDEIVEIEDFYYNQFLGEAKHIGVKVIKNVIKHKLDLLFTSQIGEISFHMLKDNFVDIYRVEEGLTVREILERYHKEHLEEITMPTHSVEESQVEKE